MTTWRVQIRDSRHGQHDLVIDGDPDSSTTELEAQLEASGFRSKPLTVGGTPVASTTSMAQLHMTHGSVLTAGHVEIPKTIAQPGSYLVAVSGPDAGGWWFLEPGHTGVIGRSTTVEHHLNDTLMSSNHARIGLADGTTVLEDLDSTNGTLVEGQPLRGETAIAVGTYFQLGASVFTVIEVDRGDLAYLGQSTGSELAFHRAYRGAMSELPASVDPPAARKEAASSKYNWWRALLPVVSGVGFAAITGRWIFLLVVVISPIVIAVDSFRTRKKKEQDAAEGEVAYQAEMSKFDDRLSRLRSDERDRVRNAAIIGGTSNLLGFLRHRRLWERRPSDDDFGWVAVGLAALPSRISVRGDSDEHEAWGTPLRVDLLNTGSLAVVGQVERARAVVRSMLMNMSVTHAPSDLKIWILTDTDHETEWGFARWLPHTFRGTHGCRIATTPQDRTAFVKELRQLIDNRADVAGTETLSLPIHVVVFDGANILIPADLADILGRGPAYGIVGMTVDRVLAPEGVKGTLTIGEAADDAVFESSVQPRVRDLATTEMSPAWAERAALRIAALRPSADAGDEETGGTIHLVDLLGLGEITSKEIAERWQAVSPRASAVVGLASGTPMVVDIARDGPHGLVGGMSGSGKTEFLMTWLVSMCLSNHPDDLAIVIADFKGGVDHEHIKHLPHVMDVATNRDPASFKRTLALLGAERERRQDLFTTAGVQNLDAYRIARAERQLVPIPRLLVVVDEFSELLASDEGREHLKELESITRTGRALGIHLVLVTQNFENQLPSQIDANAPLRVCLMVQAASHSKVVLQSPIAATIPDSAKGRAYARFHGRDLIEFQTARVAGKRKGLNSETPPIELRLLPFGALASAAPDRRSDNVPVEQSDLWALLGALNGAARETGWKEPAVPWPSGLEPVSFDRLEIRRGEGVIPIGRVDLPEQQKQATSYLSDRDEQVAFVGGSRAMLPEILTAVGLSAALLRDPNELHIYGIDMAGGGLSPIGRLPHCGALAIRSDDLGLRIIDALSIVASERRVLMGSVGAANVWEYEERSKARLPRIMLLVNGADRLLRSGDGDPSLLFGPMSRLLAEGLGVGIQVILAGLPPIIESRLGRNIDRRFIFRLADPAIYKGLGVPREFASDLEAPRRAADVAAQRLVQFLRFGDADVAEHEVIEATVQHLISANPPDSISEPPLQFNEVAWPLPYEVATASAIDPGPGFVRPIPVGVAADSGEWMWVDAEEDGPALAITGPPKSGRSNALICLGRLAVRMGWRVPSRLAGTRRSPLDAASEDGFEPSALAELDWRLSEGSTRPTLVLIDDIHRFDEQDGPMFEKLFDSELEVFTALSGSLDFLSGRSALRRALPSEFRSGLLLAPNSITDGMALNLSRLPHDQLVNPRPGKGYMVMSGERSPIQIPLC